MQAITLFFGVLALVAGVLIFGPARKSETDSEQCARLGGHYYHARDGSICLRRDAVIELK
jgi:hypothetical protein